jgi:hypothetical protein
VFFNTSYNASGSVSASTADQFASPRCCPERPRRHLHRCLGCHLSTRQTSKSPLSRLPLTDLWTTLCCSPPPANPSINRLMSHKGQAAHAGVRATNSGETIGEWRRAMPVKARLPGIKRWATKRPDLGCVAYGGSLLRLSIGTNYPSTDLYERSEPLGADLGHNERRVRGRSRYRNFALTCIAGLLY